MSFASDQLTRIEAVLAKTSGAKSVNVDGVSISFDDLIAQRKHWQQEVANEAGSRSVLVGISLGDE